MIFIITPNLADFKTVVTMRKIPVKYNFNGLPKHPGVRWITSWRNFLGLKIKKHDEVIYGYDYNRFSKEELERLPVEIAMRTR